MADDAQLRFEIRLSGLLVAYSRLPLSELERVAGRVRTTLRHVAIVLSNHGPSGTGGRVSKFIENAVDLNVVGSPRSGSFVLELEAPPPAAEDQDELFRDFAPGLVERAVEAFVSGLENLNDDLDELPKGFDRGVLQAVTGFRQTFNRGIDEIRFTVADGQAR
jgi:hypothetical protein